MTQSAPTTAAEQRQFVRDRLVALLVLLNLAAGTAIPAPELTAAIRDFDLDAAWIDELLDGPDADWSLASLPDWLTLAPDSGLSVLVESYLSDTLDGHPDASDAQVRMNPLIRSLDRGVLEQFAKLWANCPDGTTGATGIGKFPGPAHAAVFEMSGGQVAIALAEPAPVVGPKWIKPQNWTILHLTAARQAVVDLLAQFPAVTVGAQPASASGVWSTPAPADDPAIGLGWAMEMLTTITELPPPAVMVIGSLTAGTGSAPMTESEISRRLETVGRIGVAEILAPTEEGWVLANGRGLELLTGKSSVLSLDACATAVWGASWTTWKSNQHRDELLRLGWVPELMEPLPTDVVVRQVTTLRRIFQGETPESPRPINGVTAQQTIGRRQAARTRRVAVIGGTARSGKTTIARMLSDSLRRKDWQIQALRSTRGELPDRDMLIDACGRAISMMHRDEKKRCLLILDGLLPLQSRNNAVDALLPLVSEAVGVSVIAILEYDVAAGLEWSTNNLDVVTAVVGKPQLKKFIERMCAEHPGTLDQDAGLKELKRSDGTRDLEVLIRVMRIGAGCDPVLACFDGLDAHQQLAVSRTAAASLIRSGVPHSTLEALAEDQRQALGVKALDGQGLLNISSIEDSTRLLQRHLRLAANPQVPEFALLRNGEAVPALVVSLLMPRFEELMRSEPGNVLPFLLGARLYRGRVAAELLDGARRNGALAAWLSKVPVAELARCLTSLETSLDHEVAGDVVLQFTQRLRNDATPLGLRDLLVVIRGIRHARTTNALVLDDVRSWLKAQVQAVLASGEGTAQERLHLLERTAGFQDALLHGLVLKMLAEVVSSLDPARAADYFLALRALRLQRQLWRRVAEDSSVHYEDAAAYHPVDQEPGPEALLAHRAAVGDGFAVVLAGMMWRRQVDRTEWATMIDEYQDLLQPSLDISSPREVISALRELRRTSGMHRNEIFKRAIDRRDSGRYLKALRDLIRRATPMEIVEILRTVQGMHAWCACLLLRDNSAPDNEFARALAQATKNDPRAAGMLLSVTYSVEDQYHQDGESFAQLLGNALGIQTVAEWLGSDPRPSVKYYLVKGLWEAQISYRHRCLDLMVEIVAESLTISRRAWGPRLALRIGADPEYGPAFLSSLRDNVNESDVLAGMSVSSPPDAQAEFHRLARALYPDAAFQFAQMFDVRGLAHRLANAPTVAAAEACREVIRTLRQTPGTISGALLLQKTGRLISRPNVWLERLDTVKTDEEFTQVLRILDQVDRGSARRLLVDYAARTSWTVRMVEEQRLVARTRSAVYQNPLAATAMLAALEDIAGLGAGVYEQLNEDAGVMKIFTDELQLLQNPSEQYSAALHLTRIGVGPQHPRNADWTRQTYELKKLIMATVSSPRASRDILRTVALWHRRWATELIPKIDRGKLSRRLRLGLIADLEPAVQLASILSTLDDPEGASAVLDMLEEASWEFVVEHIDLPIAIWLLRVVEQVRTHRTGAVASAINASIVRLMAQEIVLDDRAMWRDLGHAFQAMSIAGYPVRVDQQPVRAPLLADAPAVSRALQWFPPTAWRIRHQDLAIERLISHPPRSPRDLTHALAGASAVGRLGDLLPKLDKLDLLPQASFRELADLSEFAESYPDLAMALQPYQDSFESQLLAPTSAASLDANRLRNGLSRLAAWHTVDDAG